MPNAIIKPPLLRFEQKDIRVSDRGEYVEFTVGNSTLTMQYEQALKISQMLRVHAKRAKRRAGDLSRHWSAIATLEDLK